LILKEAKMRTKYNLKGQGTIEFIVIFAFVLFFFALFFSIVQVNTYKKNLEKERIVVQNIALDVQYEINLAAESSIGYSREFKIPLNVFGKDYDINISDNRVYVLLDGYGTSYRIQNISGSVQKGVNLIQNQNGSVFLN